MNFRRIKGKLYRLALGFRARRKEKKKRGGGGGGGGGGGKEERNRSQKETRKCHKNDLQW